MYYVNKKKDYNLFSAWLFLFFPYSVFSAEADSNKADPLNVVKIFDPVSSDLLREFYIDEPGLGNGFSLAVADLGEDGIPEIILGSGKGGEPWVLIYSTIGELINKFLVYQKEYRGGVNVAVGDLNGDGVYEIITSTGEGGGPHIRIFDGWGSMRFTPGFFAFKKDYFGGVHIAAGDINNDGRDEILATSARGRNRELRIFDFVGNQLDYSFDLANFYGLDGVHVSTIDLGGDGQDEIVFTGSFGDRSNVYLYQSSGQEINHFLAFGNFIGGINTAAIDIDNDNMQELIVAPSITGPPVIKVFDGFGVELQSFFACDQDFRAGINVSALDIDGDGDDEIIAVPERSIAETEYDDYKLITVDLSEQKLYVLQNG